jgi:hypothetical protein
MKKKDIRDLIRETLEQHLSEAGEPEPKPKDGEEAPAAQPDADTPAQQAHGLGLKYAGWSTWEDETGKPVAKTVGDKLVKIDLDKAAGMADPYANDQPPVTLAPKFGHNKIKGQGTNPEKPDAVKAASSDGGAGSFKGHVTKDPMEFPALTPTELIAVHKAAQVLEQKHGSKEKAAAKLIRNLSIMKKKFDMLQGHNSNDSQQRYDRLKELQHTIDKLEATIKALAGKSVGQPGSISPPKGQNGEPVEVNINGEPGYLDAVEGDTALVTLHSGKSVAIPTSQVNNSSTST